MKRIIKQLRLSKKKSQANVEKFRAQRDKFPIGSKYYKSINKNLVKEEEYLKECNLAISVLQEPFGEMKYYAGKIDSVIGMVDSLIAKEKEALKQFVH